MKLVYRLHSCTYMTYGKEYEILSYDPNKNVYCYCANDFGVISMFHNEEFYSIKKHRKQKLDKITK